MNKDDKLALLIGKLRALRLIGMADAIADVLEHAAKDNLTTLDVLDQLADEERNGRSKRAVARRINDAHFPEINTIDAFDFSCRPARKRIKARYLALHDMAFLETGTNPLFIGTPGTGKTFLARALAYAACQAQKRVLVISAPKMLNELHGAELHGDAATSAPTSSSSTTSPCSAWTRRKPSSPSRSSPSATIIAAPLASLPTDRSRIGQKSCQAPSTLRSSPSDSPSAPSTSSSTERATELEEDARTIADRPPPSTGRTTHPDRRRLCANGYSPARILHALSVRAKNRLPTTGWINGSR